VQTNELGVRVGYLEELGGGDLAPAFPTSGSAPAFGLFYSRYLESGFALSVGVDVGIQEVPSQIAASSPTQIPHAVALYPQVALRYYLREDDFRPFVGVEVSYFQILFDADPSGYPAIGGGGLVGLEYTLTDELALGVVGSLTILGWLDKPTIYEPRLMATFSTLF
jgi:hypothetical protein